MWPKSHLPWQSRRRGNWDCSQWFSTVENLVSLVSVIATDRATCRWGCWRDWTIQFCALSEKLRPSRRHFGAHHDYPKSYPDLYLAPSVFQGPGVTEEPSTLPKLQPELLPFLCPLTPNRGTPECDPDSRLMEISTVEAAAEINL